MRDDDVETQDKRAILARMAQAEGCSAYDIAVDLIIALQEENWSLRKQLAEGCGSDNLSIVDRNASTPGGASGRTRTVTAMGQGILSPGAK